MDTDTKSSTPPPPPKGGMNQNTRSCLLLIVPNFLHTDQHTVNKMQRIFDDVGSIQQITPGVFCVVTDKAVTGWVSQIPEQFGVDFQFYLVPVGLGELAHYRQYLPPPITSAIGAQLRVA